MVMPGPATLIHEAGHPVWRFPAMTGSPFSEPRGPVGHVDVDAESGHWAQHALVIVGLDETSVQVLDPAQDEQVIAIPRADFTLAWDEMDNTCAVITRRT